MKPWEAGGGPGDTKIRELAETQTATGIAQTYGVTRSTAEGWMRKAGCAPAPRPRLSHKKFLPWPVRRVHSWSSYANALRAGSTLAQGETPDPNHLYQYKKLMRHLQTPFEYAPHGHVMNYDPVEGFFLVPRDPGVDDPDLPIRRPAG